MVSPNLHRLLIDKLEVWWQIHDIPKTFRKDHILTSLGSWVGQMMEMEMHPFDSSGKDFFR